MMAPKILKSEYRMIIDHIKTKELSPQTNRTIQDGGFFWDNKGMFSVVTNETRSGYQT